MSFPYIFTFYSFKGGVGRTMAAANVAYALASRGRNVLLLDMDLEAPGLSTFFHKSKEITEKSPLDVLDLLGWAQDWARTHPGGDPDFDAIAKEGPNLGAYTVRVPDEKVPHPRLGETGRLDLLLVDPGRDYLRRFEELHLPDLSRDLLVRISRTLWGYFKSRRFPREVPEYYGLAAQPEDPYDYVLVDSRTGYTEIGALCIGPLADRLVVFTGLNVQNVEGTADFLKTVGVTKVREESDKPHDEADAPPSDSNTPPRLGPKPTLLVASPVPIGETRLKYAQLKALQKRMNLPVATTLTYHPLHAVRETIFVRDWPREYLAKEYGELADRLMGMVEDHAAQLAGASTKAWKEGQKAAAIEAVVRLSPHEPNLGVPLLVQLADVMRPATQDEFGAADRMYRILASERLEGRWAALSNWATMLTDWAGRTDDAGLKATRLAEAIARLDVLLAANAAPTDVRAHGLLNRGVAKHNRGDVEGAIADFTAVADVPDAPAHPKAKARFNRGVAYGKKGDPDREMADYTAVIQAPDAPADQKANARVNRGAAYGKKGDPDKAIGDCTAVIEDPDAPADQKANARVNRGVVYHRKGDPDKAIADYTAVIEDPNAPADQKANARVNRGVAYGKEGEPGLEMADYTAVIDDPAAPADQKAKARLNRGVAYGQKGEPDREIADYTAVIEDPDAPAEQRAKARVNRGVAYGERGDTDRAITELAAVIEDPAAPAEQKAKARVNRAVVYGQKGDPEKAIADYTAVIEDPAAPAEQKAQARVNRGVAFGEKGDPDRGMADYTAVIEDPDAPAEQKARASGNLGWLRYEAGDLEGSVAATRQALGMAPALHWVRANLGLALLRLGRTEEALREYQSAIRGIADPAELERVVVSDLRKAMQAVDDLPGAEAVLEMVERRKREIEAARHSG